MSNLNSIWFWQRFVSPHKYYLADELGSYNKNVNYVANDLMTYERRKMGWNSPKPKKSKILVKKNTDSIKKLISKIPVNSVHLCQGIRGNGLVGEVQKILKKKKLKQWLFMEIVEDNGFLGLLRRFVYKFLLFYYRKDIEGILAIGNGASTWYSEIGFDSKKIYPFAYFMSDNISKIVYSGKRLPKFRFIFVGQLIERKRLDVLIKALYPLKNSLNFELQVVGDGPLKKKLNLLAEKLLPKRVKWLGSMSIKNIPKKIAGADCLVLPSRHDGWGSVVSESLMVGTPVICSDSCGALTAVKASKVGGTFNKDNLSKFSLILKKTLIKGRISNQKRNKIRKWAKCLGAKAGSKYLFDILKFSQGQGNRPKPPWIKAER